MKYRDRTGSEVTLPDRSGPPEPPPQPCGWCRKETRHATLVNYGGRCFRCFEDYCAQGVRGGAPGYADGKRDTPQQAEMRQRLRNGPRRPAPEFGELADDFQGSHA